MLLRPPRRDDAAAVAELLAPRNRDALGWSQGTLGDLLGEWGRAGFDLSRDAVVAAGPDRVIAGYAVAHRFGTFAVVDPSREGEGIGSTLLDWCEARQRALGWERHRSSIPASNDRARELLLARGYGLVRSHWRMVIALGDLQAPAAPPGVTLRTELGTDPEDACDGAPEHRLDSDDR